MVIEASVRTGSGRSRFRLASGASGCLRQHLRMKVFYFGSKRGQGLPADAPRSCLHLLGLVPREPRRRQKRGDFAIAAEPEHRNRGAVVEPRPLDLGPSDFSEIPDVHQ